MLIYPNSSRASVSKKFRILKILVSPIPSYITIEIEYKLSSTIFFLRKDIQDLVINLFIIR